MKNQMLQRPIITVLILLATCCSLTAQYRQTTEQPLCGRQYICSDVAEYYEQGYCLTSFRPTVCLCSTNGAIINSVAYCERPVSRGGSVEPVREIDPEELINHPAGVFMTPFVSGERCAIRYGKRTLVVQSDQSGVGLCKKNCEGADEWVIRLVEEGDALQGYHIQPVGQENVYLALSEGGAITLASPTDNMTEAESKRMVWHVGAGALKDRVVTGYRFMTGTNYLAGLAFDKKTNTPTVCDVFLQTDKTDGENQEVEFSVNKACRSVWTIEVEPGRRK